jgi:hypothetical protein
MFLGETLTTSGGRQRARRCFAWTAALLLGLGAPAGAQPVAAAAAAVREDRGVYVVSAEFTAAAAAAVVLDTLTDYENIPRFMRAVTRSRVLERGDGYSLVEQEALATFMLFSKRVHLTLDVREQPDLVRFTDRCGRSFARYEGSWTLTERDGRTTIGYHLTAQPSFDVPAFLLKRLLKRDALEMIAGLQAEIAARARPRETAGPAGSRIPVRDY